MADQDEGPPRPRSAGAHDTESSRITAVENQTGPSGSGRAP